VKGVGQAIDLIGVEYDVGFQEAEALLHLLPGRIVPVQLCGLAHVDHLRAALAVQDLSPESFGLTVNHPN
jgi:hypothetical protein